MLSEPRVERPLPMLVAGQTALAFAQVAAVIAIVPVLFWPTTLSMIRTWIGTITFNHCFLVLPISLWLIWRRRVELVSRPMHPYWPALIALVLLGALWLLANLASSVAPAQWAMVAMIPVAILAIFGLAWTRVIVFPLLFLFFAVPFGEVLVPTLIDWTADFTTAALQLLGVPVLREGSDLTIPTGRWSVVEACSGVRFLIATVVAGCLFAHLNMRSPLRRITFVAASVVVPVVANWLRAFLIVLIGHFSNNRIAAGVDHLVYGWVFFAIVLFLLLWAGTFWREQQENDTLASPKALPVSVRPAVAPVAAVLVAALVWPIALAALERPLGAALPARPVIAARDGWVETPAPIDWQPELVGPTRVAVFGFAKNDMRVGVVLAQFRDQMQGKGVVNYRHRFVAEGDPTWRELRREDVTARIADQVVNANAMQLLGNGKEVQVWQWYWSRQVQTGNEVRAKIALLEDRLRDRTDDGVWIALFAVDDAARPASAVLARFAAEMGAALDASLQAASAVR